MNILFITNWQIRIYPKYPMIIAGIKKERPCRKTAGFVKALTINTVIAKFFIISPFH
jgi:hypothetical protein